MKQAILFFCCAGFLVLGGLLSSCDDAAPGTIGGDLDAGAYDSAPAPDCDDGVLNGDETDVDCGGICSLCDDGLACTDADDCLSGLCGEGVCLEPTCTDGVLNQDESDGDCGGSCEPCDDGSACNGADDCGSGVCDESVCAEAACDDGTQNGAETDVDCGGSCAP